MLDKMLHEESKSKSTSAKTAPRTPQLVECPKITSSDACFPTNSDLSLIEVGNYDSCTCELGDFNFRDSQTPNTYRRRWTPYSTWADLSHAAVLPVTIWTAKNKSTEANFIPLSRFKWPWGLDERLQANWEIGIGLEACLNKTSLAKPNSQLTIIWSSTAAFN